MTDKVTILLELMVWGQREEVVDYYTKCSSALRSLKLTDKTKSKFKCYRKHFLPLKGLGKERSAYSALYHSETAKYPDSTRCELQSEWHLVQHMQE